MKKNALQKVENLSVETIPDKEELRAQMRVSLETINKKLKKLGGTTQVVFKAASAFKMNENDSNTVNIQTCGDLVYLIKALALVKRVKAEFYQIVEELEVNPTPICVWYGQNVDFYIHDLEIRIKQVANAKQLAELVSAKQRLETFMSEEDRLVKTLEDVSLLLK